MAPPPWVIAWIRWAAIGGFVLASLAVATKIATAPGSLPDHLIAGLCALGGLGAAHYPDAVQLRVTNGPKAPADLLGPAPEVREEIGDRSVGLGAVGMRERASLSGRRPAPAASAAQLRAGPTTEGELRNRLVAPRDHPE